MENLPNLPLLKIAKNLTPEEVTRLSSTCRRFRDLLPRFLRFRGKNFQARGPDRGHFVPELYFNGPPLQATVNSFRSTVRWKDQGWGNQKGQIIVKLMRPGGLEKEKQIAEKDMFGIAMHEWKTSTCLLTRDHLVVKLSEPGDYYRFIRNPGGGGGHMLYVENFSVLLEFK